jgi:predicted nucleic acid-binding protein
MGLIVSIYLDTNALIQLVEEGHEGLSTLLEGGHNSGRRLVTSELALAEVLVGPMQSGTTHLADIYEELLAGSALIETIAVDRPILRKSAEIRATLGGKLPDAIHIATAVHSGCSVVLSSDRRLRIPHPLRRVAVEEVENWDEWQ